MAFINGRQIIDDPLMVDGIISWAKKNKKRIMFFKVDFEKAFDSLSWSFLFSILEQIGFSLKWINWIHACLKSAFASVLVNGSSTKEFKVEKGLRQGLPIGAKMSRCLNWNPLVGPVLQTCFLCGKSMTLTFGGRPYLTYNLFLVVWVSTTFLPLKLQRRLLDKTIPPRNKGGLGIGSLKASNHALLAKWWWKFFTEDNTLWSKVIRSIHGPLCGLFDNSPLKYTSGPWLDTNRNFHVSYRCPTVMFNTSSKSFFGPTVSAMGLVHPPGLVFHWAWRRELLYAPEIAELGDMVSLLSQLHLSDIPDSWTCIIDNSRMFLVKNMCSLITHMSTSLVDQQIRWNKWLPSKVNILTWRISNKRLLTRVNIDRRGIDIDSIRCPICNGDFKSEDYLFVSCVIAIEIWKNILDCFTDLETEYPAIVFNDASDAAFSCEPTVSPLNNNKIDFNISFDESDDEDYMVIFDENSFSCKIISIDNLKTDSENENDKVNMPPSLSPEPMFGYIDDLDFFKDFENEFPAIAYNDLKSKSDPLNEPSLRVEARDDMGRAVNRVHVLDFAGLTDGMRQTLGDRLSMVYTGDDGHTLFTSHAWRRMSDIEMGLDVADTLCFQLGGARRRMTWRLFILALGLHSEEEMAEAGFGADWSGSKRVILDKGDLRDYWMEISSNRDFLGLAPSYVHIKDHVRRLCHRMIACSISGRGQEAEKYLFRHAEGRKSGSRLSGGHFIRRLAAHFGLVGDQGLRGLSVVVSELLVINLHELARFNIYSRFGDTWAWVASGPERQQAAAAGAPGAAEDALAADEGAQAVPAPVLEAWVALGPERQQAAAAGAPGAAEDVPAANEGAQAVPAPVQAP
ncbi:retrovirus-related pol polyprotein from transposon TNT 1-94 [Tanacetum coccineum]